MLYLSLMAVFCANPVKKGQDTRTLTCATEGSLHRSRSRQKLQWWQMTSGRMYEWHGSRNWASSENSPTSTSLSRSRFSLFTWFTMLASNDSTWKQNNLQLQADATATEALLSGHLYVHFHLGIHYCQATSMLARSLNRHATSVLRGTSWLRACSQL